jgi:hypothetical protein
MGNLLSLDPKIHSLRADSKEFCGLLDGQGTLILSGSQCGVLDGSKAHTGFLIIRL